MKGLTEIESRVSAEIGRKTQKSELERLLLAKAKEARIDSYRRSNPMAPARDIMLAAASPEIEVLMTTEKSGDITKYKFFVPVVKN